MLALGLDTSCYTTSAALCGFGGLPRQERRLLPVPKGERGLRQSEAVFAHVRQLPKVLLPLLSENKEKIDCVCASDRPRDGEESYMPVFQVGVSQGKAIAAALNVPFFTTTHQRGHIAAAKYGTGLETDRFVALHLSGGTTDTLFIDGDALTPLGTSCDLHAGQLVDRIGVKLGLPFPAGPYLEELAVKGQNKNRVPVSFESDGLRCHLSGAEAQLLRLIKMGEAWENVAAEVYGVLCRTVLRLVQAAAEAADIKDVLIAGGVASSRLLRDMLTERNEKRRTGLNLYFGRPEFSGDNAVGVALIGLERLRQGGQDGIQKGIRYDPRAI
ncbi:MAG: O-sialoglycoprotein endopeptidase [Clostridia bacterium]|nr:O-sialoglycoprotein endopeptidase [Clostridia bacterium]